MYVIEQNGNWWVVCTWGCSNLVEKPENRSSQLGTEYRSDASNSGAQGQICFDRLKAQYFMEGLHGKSCAKTFKNG